MLPIYYLLIISSTLPNHWLFSHQFGALTVTKIIGLLALLAAPFYISKMRVLKFLFPGWPIFLFFLFTGVQALEAIGSDLATAAKMSSIISLFVITAIVVSSTRNLNRTIIAVTVAVSISSAYSIRQYIQFAGQFKNFRSFGGLTTDVNYFALNVLMWVPVWVQWGISTKSKVVRCLLLSVLGVNLLAFTLGASRGGFISVVAGLLFLATRSKKVMFASLLLAIISTPVLVLAPSSPVRRLFEPTSSDEKSAGSRRILWEASYKIFLANPILGAGPDNYKAKMQWVSPDAIHNNAVHNTYLELAGQGGLVALLPFVGLLAVVFRRLGGAAKKAARAGNRDVAQVAQALQAGLIGVVLDIGVISAWWHMVLWLFLFTCIWTIRLAEGERADAVPIAAPLPPFRATMRVPERTPQRKVQLTRRSIAV